MNAVMRGISKSLAEIALKLKNDAQNLCPKDTGRLAESIGTDVFEVTDNSIVIGTFVEYAPYVELGTGPMINAHGKHDYKRPVKTWKAKRARGSTDPTTMPFMASALYMNLRWIARTLARYIKQEVRNESSN